VGKGLALVTIESIWAYPFVAKKKIAQQVDPILSEVVFMISLFVVIRSVSLNTRAPVQPLRDTGYR
jgi:hypothetical protein